MAETFSPLYQIEETDWQKFKDFRIRAVSESPQAFGDTLEKINGYSNSYWINGIKNNKVFVIDDDSKYVSGVVFVQDDDGVWSIKSLWTEPVYRGKGLAMKLLQHVLDVAKNIGVDAIKLGVNAKQTDAIKLYETLGFAEIKTISDLAKGDGSKNDLIVMRLDLE